MGEETNDFSSGILYICNPDGEYKHLGTVNSADISYAYDCDALKYISPVTGLESTFETTAKLAKDILLKISGIYYAIIHTCPNKQVVHLALNGRTHKIRKKNLHRAIKILEGMK